MKRNTIVTLVTILFFTVQAAAQTEVNAWTPGISSEGVTYALPATRLRVAATAQRIAYTPGPLARYAERLLGVSGVSAEPSVSHTLLTLELTTEGVPDTTKIYTMKLKNKRVTPLASLDANGVLLSVGVLVDEDENGGHKAVTVAPAENVKHAAVRPLSGEALSATSTAKMAETIAQQITDLRESRTALLRGEAENAPSDGDGMRLVLDELRSQENSLLAMFTGVSDTTTVDYVTTYLPTGDVKARTLFRFSNKLGFVDADDLSGAPYTLTLRDQHTVPLPQESNGKKGKPIDGVVYNLPSTAKVSIADAQGRVILQREIQVAQFGTIDSLSPTLWGRENNTEVWLQPSTGAIRQIK